jgi:hypothetical protein
MKYLVIAQPGTTPIPPEQGAALYRAAKEFMNAQLADGRVDCHYVFPEAGGFVIANADSHEEIWERLVAYPLYPFLVWEVKALCDWGHVYDRTIENYQQLAG